MIRKRTNKVSGTMALVGVTLAPLSTHAQDPAQMFEMRDRPTLNFYGSPGIIDMPSGEALPDRQFTVGISHFGGITRNTLTFQATPRISASFRYLRIALSTTWGTKRAQQPPRC